MVSRREFFARVLAAASVIGVCPERVARATAGRSPTQPKYSPGCFVWQRTVFLQVEDSRLAALVGQEAGRLGSKVVFGDPEDPDLYAIPYFIAIVHRWSLGRERWRDFVEHQAEVEDATPIVVVDGYGAEGDWAIGKSMEIIDWTGLRERDGLRLRASSTDTVATKITRAIRVAHGRAMAWRGGERFPYG